MKYEAIQRAVARDVRAKIESGVYGSQDAAIAALLDSIAERRPFADSFEALSEQCERRVMAWDVRRVGKLRELFPDSFPRKLRTGPLVADYDEAGDWAVESAQ